MREISAHEAFKSQTCDKCGISEVSREGDICSACQYLIRIGGGEQVFTAIKRERVPVKPISRTEVKRMETQVGLNRVDTASDEAPLDPPLLSERIFEGGYLCKGGCGVKVASNKGLAGWCGQEKNGCRKKEIERRQQEKGLGPKAKTETDHWLTSVRSGIEAAMKRVEEAEGDLKSAKDDLAAILKQAQETLK